jgi:hypothetical protein
MSLTQLWHVLEKETQHGCHCHTAGVEVLFSGIGAAVAMAEDLHRVARYRRG